MSTTISVTVDGNTIDFTPTINEVLTNGLGDILLQIKWETPKGSFTTYGSVSTEDLIMNFRHYESMAK